LVVAIAVVAALFSCGKPATDQTPQSIAQPTPPTPSTPVESSTSFALGVVESGSQQSQHIEPIAHFTGTDWIHAWPAAEDESAPFPALTDVPEAWLGGPLPRTWTLWIDGSAPVSARVLKTYREAGCSVPIVLGLDTRAPDGQSNGHGLAVSTAQSVAPVRPINSSDPDWQELAAAATAALIEHRAEAVEKAYMKEAERAAFSAQLPQLPVTLDAVYRSAEDRTVYYFQANQWTKPRDMEAPHVQVWGWMRRDESGHYHPMAVEGRAGAGSEEGMLSPQRQSPLGAIRTAGRTFWILWNSGLESYAYDITEITPTEIITRLRDVGGGGC
jgi:hypothetical protein